MTDTCNAIYYRQWQSYLYANNTEMLHAHSSFIVHLLCAAELQLIERDCTQPWTTLGMTME